jgi:alkaline phosphatase D
MKIFALVALLLAPRLGEGSRLPHPDVLKAENKEQFLRAVSGRRRLAELEEPIPARDLQADSTQILADEFGGIPGFYHGVASGDPLPTQVILWTRYTPVSAGEEITLNVLIAKVDPNLAVEDHLKASANPNLVRAPVLVTQESGFVAKLDVIGLEPGTKYVFAFTDGVRASEVGLTQTAPANLADVASMTYAFFSCSHFSNGYFHAYDVASTITDLDLWIHVGDYFVS